jgi:hypothetical protein
MLFVASRLSSKIAANNEADKANAALGRANVDWSAQPVEFATGKWGVTVAYGISRSKALKRKKFLEDQLGFKKVENPIPFADGKARCF